MAKTILDFGNVIAITDGATIENYISKPFNYYIDVNDQLTVVSADGRKLSLAAGDFAAYADNAAIIAALRTAGINQNPARTELLQNQQFYGAGNGLAVADTADFEFLFSTGSASDTIDIRVSCLAGWTFTLFAGTTVSANGNAIMIINKNFATVDNGDISVFDTPTVTGDGFQLVQKKVNADAEELSLFNGEIVMTPTTNFMVRCTNGTGAPADVGMSFQAIE